MVNTLSTKNTKRSKTVFVGMSGGVDSSVTALLLKEAGFRVVGVYMKNWTKNLPGFDCPWKDDYQDAKRVAVQLKIDFKVFDFETEYKQKVVDYMIDEFKSGLTPNPDIMCNQEIKFKLFLETALEQGADKAKDSNKDHTYFLYRVSEGALKKTLFPLGEYNKPEVRKIAIKHGLITANKKESMGICFVGKVGIKEFLSQYVKSKPGNIINELGDIIGEHDGAIYYTIGQRHGLNVGGGLPYYVTGKNMTKNIVYVTTDLNSNKLWYKTINFTNAHYINKQPSKLTDVDVCTRHRAGLVCGTLNPKTNQVDLKDEIRALTPGQSVVFYQKEYVLGGGVIV